MRKPIQEKFFWYEVQRLYNQVEGQSDGEWLTWEQFSYDHTTRTAQPRLKARTLAKRETLNSHFLGFKSRLIHCETIFETE